MEFHVKHGPDQHDIRKSALLPKPCALYSARTDDDLIMRLFFA